MRNGSWIFCLTLVAACAEDATSAGGGDGPSLAASSSSSGGTSGSAGSSGLDAGAGDAPPSAPPPTCERAKAAASAPLALYESFIADPAPASRTSFLAELALRGGTPFESSESDVVTFIALGDPPAGPWKVSGSFNGWSAETALAMTHIDGTDVWKAETTIPRGASFEYKLVSGDQWIEDPLAGTVVWDGIDRGFGVRGEMNAVGHPGALPMTRGRMTPIRRVHATKLDDDRDVWIHRPAAYDTTDCAKKLPSIVFHDGLESLTRGAFAKVADELYAERPELAAVLIFVGLPSQDVRMAQYTFASDGARGSDYVDFLANDLWPRIEKDARICKSPLARGISGASLGGLISTFAAFEKPDQWGWVGAQSASYFWADSAMIARVQDEPKKPIRFYLDSGCPDDNCAVTDQMDAALTAKGYEHVRVKAQGASHDWSFWRDRLRGLLAHFREDQATCD